jgi:aspartyl-tRNA(Asn)/glutamyl-tRNA(Gln) amidotransferase subunit C
VQLSKEDVTRVAALAQIHVEPPEVEALVRDLSRILDYASDLLQVEGLSVLPTLHGAKQGMPLRPDEVRPSLPVQRVLANAPDVEDNCFRVPPVLGDNP